MIPEHTRPILLALALVGTLATQTPAKVDFARDIQPILREHCVECHGPSQQMRGFRLDRRRDALPNRVGANGVRIVPGSSAKSVLFRRVSGTESGAQMPPAGPLPTEKIALLKNWIDQGADWPDAVDGERKSTAADPVVTRMMQALRVGKAAEFHRLVASNPKSVNGTGQRGWTPLMYAALYGDAGAVRLLLEKGANANAQNEDGGTALMYATEDAAKTAALLKGGANPNLKSGEGKTVLHIAAAQFGAYPVVKALLDGGADIKVQRPNGPGVLLLAMGARDPALVKLLLDRGVEQRPLPLAQSLAGCSACFDLLLPLAQPGDLTGALSSAVRVGDVPRINLLLERGAKPATNLLQLASMTTAAIPVDILRTLITKSGGPNYNALHFAARQGNLAMLEAIGRLPGPDESQPSPIPIPKPAESSKAAIARSIPILQRSDKAFLDRAGCVSCHNNSLTAMTVAAARTKKIPFDPAIAKSQLSRIAAFLEENAENALENNGLPGGVDTVSYILLGLAAEKYPSDAITDVWARYVKNTQSPDGRWRVQSMRPPLESSDFEVTAAAIRSVRAYGPKSQRAQYDKAAERGVRWLETAEPLTTEDYAFKLMGLVWGGGNAEAIRTTAKRLLAMQDNFGGWSQVKGLSPDAYATGQALTALREARAIAPGDAWQRGIQFLMKNQLADGSWYVAGRAIPIQPPMDADFPHGTNQFISAAATNWATMALLADLKD